MLLCVAAVLLLDVGMVVISALRAASGRKLSNGADNMYDLHDHRVGYFRCPLMSLVVDVVC